MVPTLPLEDTHHFSRVMNWQCEGARVLHDTRKSWFLQIFSVIYVLEFYHTLFRQKVWDASATGNANLTFTSSISPFLTDQPFELKSNPFRASPPILSRPTPVIVNIVENDKKRRFRNLKNLLKGLQQFLSFPTSPGYQDPPKNAILISSDRKKEFNEFTKQKYIYI